MRRNFCLVGILVFACFHLPVYADIEKKALTSDQGLCFYWWPKLPTLKGWHHDEDQSYIQSVNALAPDGYTFVNAETVMYANAVYKPRVPESKNLNQFIVNDQKGFAGASITETPFLVTADGQKIRTFLFLPKAKGNWEKVGYGEEGDFFLIFAISSRSRLGLQSSEKDFKKLINSYKS
jgi:hypothetical protein